MTEFGVVVRAGMNNCVWDGVTRESRGGHCAEKDVGEAGRRERNAIDCD